MKRIISLILLLALAASLFSCSAGESKDEGPVKVAIEVKDFGTMTFELYPDIAPITVENFLAYVDRGFYNGLTFHRIRKGFMIQGGDPNGNGTGKGDLPAIKGEFAQNGVENNLSHKYGVISMARTTDMDSATSQFFICNADVSSDLDGRYAAFGKLIEGSDVLDAISNIEVTYSERGELCIPLEKIVIERIYRVD